MIKISVLNSLGNGAIIDDPIHNADHIVHITGFVSTAIQLTKNTAPIPLFDLVLDICDLNLVSICEKSAKNGKGDQLGSIGEIAADKVL